MALELVYDRTAADVTRIQTLASKGWAGMTDEEKQFWLRGYGTVELYATDGRLTALDGPLFAREGFVRGAYNAVDLNRVEAAVAELQAVLLAAGYGKGNLTVKMDWAIGDLPQVADMTRYLGNVAALVDIFTVLSTSPALPVTMDDLTYIGENAIEKVLTDIQTAIGYMLLSYWGCGEIGCGEV
jgi:hypothetical protein